MTERQIFAVRKQVLWILFIISDYTLQLKWKAADNAVDPSLPIALHGYFSAVKLAHCDKTFPRPLVSVLSPPSPRQR